MARTPRDVAHDVKGRTAGYLAAALARAEGAGRPLAAR